ncbi:hypothetical protein PR048_024466 [Dryococelus australis]|uniref:Uncharacterized protein n=1 Tax=Dryococelus australis TaxID=614101 RepID=A0ABQ9GNS7_9NEOP|nr:hypothetical protein PR048_024466 [Dryococelus australis]
MEQRQNERAGENGRSLRRLADQRHRRTVRMTLQGIEARSSRLLRQPAPPSCTVIELVRSSNYFAKTAYRVADEEERASVPCLVHILLSHSVSGAAVAERLACSPPTKVNRFQSPTGSPDFRKWESCRTMPLVGFSRGPTGSLALSFRRRSMLTSITLIGSQDLAVKSRPDLFTHLTHSFCIFLCLSKFNFTIEKLPAREWRTISVGETSFRFVQPIAEDQFQWSQCAPPNFANQGSIPRSGLRDFRMWESCQTIPLVSGSSRDHPPPPSPATTALHNFRGLAAGRVTLYTPHEPSWHPPLPASRVTAISPQSHTTLPYRGGS